MEDGLGIRIEFESFPDVKLAFESLARERSGIELLNVRDDGERIQATVFVPDGRLDHFEGLIRDYLAEKRDRADRPRDNQRLIDAIREIRAASVRALWTDTDEAFPSLDEDPFWWEVWLPVRRDRARRHGFGRERFGAGGASTGFEPTELRRKSRPRSRRSSRSTVGVRSGEADGRQRVATGTFPSARFSPGSGRCTVRVPKSRSRSGSPEPFRSSVVPPYVGAAQASAIRADARGVHRADPGGRRAGGRGGRPRAVGERGSRLKRSMGRGVPPVRRGCTCGRRHLQRASASGFVRFVNSATRTRVHPELARGAAEFTRPAKLAAGVLGGAVGGVSNDPNAALLDAQDRTS